MANLPVVNRVSTIRDLLAKSKEQIAMALPKHMDPDRLLRISMTSIQQNPKLLNCTPQSLVACVIESSQLGLSPDGVLGHSYLVPYGDKAQLQIGYRGFLELARRSGQVASLYAHDVHEGDKYEFELGLEPNLKHIPARTDRGAIVAAYAVVRLKDGGYDFEWMWKEDIDKIRNSAKAKNGGPWKEHYPEMAKKTVIRRLAKRLPLSPEFQRAAVKDEYIDAGVNMGFADSKDVVDVTNTVDALNESIKGKKELPAPAPMKAFLEKVTPLAEKMGPELFDAFMDDTGVKSLEDLKTKDQQITFYNALKAA